MFKLLIPVDGSEKSEHAIEYLIGLVKKFKTRVKSHLLNVQLPLPYGDFKKFIQKEDIDSFYQEEGTKAMKSASMLLDQANIQYTKSIEIGQIAEIIVSYASENKFDQIIMGTRGLGAISNLLIGSVASKVIALTKLSVTLVK